MNYLTFNIKKDPQLCISTLKKDIMWNGCLISDPFTNTVYEKPLQWFCVNPKEISTNKRHTKDKRCEENCVI